MSDNIKVAIRIRPIIESEKRDNNILYWTPNADKVVSSFTSRPTSFSFDTVFGGSATNSDIFEKVVRPVIDDFLDGYNGTVFAYGQTASGKTYTMMGNETNAGIIPMTVHYIFHFIEKTPGRTYLLRFSFIEIYNELVTDLLASNQVPLKVFDGRDGMTVITDISERIVTSASELMQALIEGEQRRHFRETCMNDRSSRSHTICKMIIESHGSISNILDGDSDDSVVVSNLNLVDLAGSEKCSLSNAKESRFKEGCNINRSLLSLSLVISKLSEGNSQHINYRDSKLTRILKPSLGGNSKTTVICNITPIVYEESLSTLKFADRARSVKNKPIINEILSKDSLLKQYENEILQLKIELQNEKSQQSEVFQKKLEERDSHIYSLQEKLRLTSEKLLVSSRPFILPVISKATPRRQTWCGVSAKVSASRNTVLGNIIESDGSEELSDSFHTIGNGEEFSFTSKEPSNISDESERLVTELKAIKEEHVSTNEQLSMHAEVVAEYDKKIQYLERAVKSLRQQLEEKQESYEERLGDLLNDHKKVKEIAYSLDIQLNKETEENAVIIREKDQIVEELQRELAILKTCDHLINETTNESEKLLNEQLADWEGKYNFIVQEFESSKHHAAEERALLLTQLEELNKKYLDLQKLKNDEEIRSLLNEVIDNLPTQNDVSINCDFQNLDSQREQGHESQIASLKDTIQLSEEIIQEFKDEIVKMLEEAETKDRMHDEESQKLKVLLLETQQQLQLKIENNEDSEMYSKLKEENIKLEKEVEGLKNTIIERNTAQSKYNVELNNLQEQLVEVNKEIESRQSNEKVFEQQKCVITEENLNLKTEIENLRVIIAERDQVVVESQSNHQLELQNLHNDLDRINRELGNLEILKKSLEEQNSSFNEENTNLKNEVKKMKEIATEGNKLASDAFSNHQLECDNLREKLDQLHKALENEKEVKKILENQTSDMNEKNRNLQTEVENFKVMLIEHSNSQLELVNLRQTHIQLNRELENVEETKKILEKQISDTNDVNVKLQTEVQKLNEILTECDQRQSQFKIECDKLHDIVAQLKVAEKNADKINKTLEKQNLEVKEENSGLHIEVKKLKDERNEIQRRFESESEQLLEANEHLKKENNFELCYLEMKRKNSDLQNELITLQEENTKLQTQLNELKKVMAENTRRVTEAYSQHEVESITLRKTNTELLAKINHLNVCITKNEKESEERIRNLENTFFSLTESFEICDKQIFELLEKDQENSERMEKLKKKEAELHDQIELYKLSIHEMEEKYDNQLKQLSSTSTELEQAKELINEVKSDYELRIKELSSKITEHEQNSESVNLKLNDYESNVQELNRKITEIEESKESLNQNKEFEIHKLNSKITKLEEYKESLDKEVLEYEQSIQQLNSKVIELEECKESLNHNIQNYNGNVQNLNLKIVMLEKTNESLSDKVRFSELTIAELKQNLGVQDVAKTQLTISHGFDEMKLEFEHLKSIIMKRSGESKQQLGVQKEDFQMHTNQIQDLKNEKINLEKFLEENMKHKYQDEERKKAELQIESLNDRLKELELQNQELISLNKVAENKSALLEQELLTIKIQTNDLLDEKTKIEKIFEQQILQLEKDKESKIEELKAQYEEEILALKSQASTEKNKMSERIEFLENNRDEMEQIVDSSRQTLWEMIDEEKANHMKTKAELDLKMQDESRLSELMNQHEKEILELKSQHEAEVNKMSDRIKFLEDNRDEMEEIVDSSRRDLWEMIDEEKANHMKTKAELDLKMQDESRLNELMNQHEKEILELKSQHEAEVNKMSDRIKFLEDNRDEMEEIVDSSRRDLWEMIDKEKDDHEKTKAELEEMKLMKSLATSENKPPDVPRNPLHPLSKNKTNLQNSSLHELQSETEGVKRVNHELQKQLPNNSSEQINMTNQSSVEKLLFNKDCIINELKIQLKQKEAPLLKKIEILTKDNNSCKRRMNEMKQQLLKAQQQTPTRTISDLVNKSTTISSNYDIIDRTKIELKDAEISRLKRRLEKCNCVKLK